jgi:histidinol-phosphate aminotransferase
MKRNLIRPCIQTLHAYTPGEQPKIKGLIKLNTNENPYSPSPRVFSAIRKEVNERLRLYPDPSSDRFRERIAAVYRFKLNQVIAGNGSDDILTMCLRAFVDEGKKVQFPKPTYSLYPVLTQIQNGKIRQVSYDESFQLNPQKFDSSAALTFVVNPNAPSGTLVPQTVLKSLARRLRGVLVVDEAYVDFANENALALARKSKNVLVARSFSKSFSLAGMRLGFAVGHPDLIEALMKVKDSYNLDRLAQVAGEAALSDMDYHRKCVAKVVKTREKFCRSLEKRGWFVYPSHTNFVFVRPAQLQARVWLNKLRANKILVRWFSYPETKDYLRITIGTEAEMKQFLKAIDRI